jgi:rSAM/selenodomain-associated transferase 2
MSNLRITAIVPTWNEEDSIRSTLLGLRQGGLDEILVVDGGSQDDTMDRASEIADRVVAATGGLFAQLNHAAQEAAGDALLFHYADVQFPAAGRQAIEAALRSPAVIGGAFSLSYDSDRTRYSIIAQGANLRNRLGIGPFGDQSIFVRSEVFRVLGGFNPDVFLEDLHLVRRLKCVGRFEILQERVQASVRRWETNGLLPTLYHHWRLTLLYVLRGGGGESNREWRIANRGW